MWCRRHNVVGDGTIIGWGVRGRKEDSEWFWDHNMVGSMGGDGTIMWWGLRSRGEDIGWQWNIMRCVGEDEGEGYQVIVTMVHGQCDVVGMCWLDCLDDVILVQIILPVLHQQDERSWECP
jgi:hypothetical protein